MYVQADLRLCWSHIPHCWKSHVAAQILMYFSPWSFSCLCKQCRSWLMLHSATFQLSLFCLPRRVIKVWTVSWLYIYAGVWLGIKGLLFQVSPLVETLCCVFEQDTLSAAYYWFNPGRPIRTWLKNCWLRRKESKQTNFHVSQFYKIKSTSKVHDIVYY